MNHGFVKRITVASKFVNKKDKENGKQKKSKRPER